MKKREKFGELVGLSSQMWTICVLPLLLFTAIFNVSSRLFLMNVRC